MATEAEVNQIAAYAQNDNATHSVRNHWVKQALSAMLIRNGYQLSNAERRAGLSRDAIEIAYRLGDNNFKDVVDRVYWQVWAARDDRYRIGDVLDHFVAASEFVVQLSVRNAAYERARERGGNPALAVLLQRELSGGKI